MILHKADTRGYANHGWLKTYHSFSFANYHNPERMSFGALRVLNDDVIQPKMGFGEHPHRDMEIISIPLSGALSHKDSMGNTKSIEVDEVQVMSAGTGLTHSEFNASKTNAVNLLQLWIIPEVQNATPNYEQRQFSSEERHNKLQTIVAPKDKIEGDALPIHQQAYIYRSYLESGKELQLKPKTENHGFYIFNVEGSVNVADKSLARRDAIGIYDIDTVTISSEEDSELIIIEVPMR